MNRRKALTYQHTVYACYFANFFQAIGCVFPILLVPLRTLYGLSYTQFGILVSLNFMTQVTFDVAFSKPVDWYGFRRFAVLAPLLSSTGLMIFALTPILFPGHLFGGFSLGIMIFAGAAGLQELLLSPIVDALPMEETQRGKNMSMLHSFYAWGQIFVILVTTGILALSGMAKWQGILMGWAVIPLISSFFFRHVPLEQRVDKKDAMRTRDLLRSQVFWIAVAAIVFGGSSEVAMGQWMSAFLERGFDIPKAIGDTLGMCSFALMLALGRTAYGLFGDKISIHKVMLAGSFLAALLYLSAALTTQPLLGLLSCALTGLCVSMLWPGSIIATSRNFPLAGASMFALLSAAGDVGASAGAYAVGRTADYVTAQNLDTFMGKTLSPEQVGLHIGMLLAALFPILCFGVNILLTRHSHHE